MSVPELTIREARDRRDADACVELQRAVWGLADLEVTPAIQLLATTHAGGLLQVANTEEGRVVGFAYAFPAIKGGVLHFHSDMLGVLPEFQQHGLGARLKWAQREAALAAGVSFVTWTFDPLQVRNASLNLRRLGAAADEFVSNLYGVTTSPLHHGLPTHRLLVRWELEAARVKRLAKKWARPKIVRTPRHPRINEVKWQAGWPVSSEPDLGLDAPQLLLEIPPEFDVLSRAAPRVAEDWHSKVCRGLEHYVVAGWAAVDFAPTEESGRRRPFYVLKRAG